MKLDEKICEKCKKEIIDNDNSFKTLTSISGFECKAFYIFKNKKDFDCPLEEGRKEFVGIRYDIELDDCPYKMEQIINGKGD